MSLPFERSNAFMNNQEEGKSNMELLSAIKIQAIWRGYATRKNKIQSCYACGYPLMLPDTTPSRHPCSWCQEMLAYEEAHRCNCGDWLCAGGCDPYIPCRVCSSNCYGDDYEKWRFCSRSCMVEASRD